MAVTGAITEKLRRTGEPVERCLQEIEQIADADEWEKIEAALHRLPTLIERIPGSLRRDVLIAAKTLIDRIHQRALVRNDEIGAQLATLKTGRRATASYQETSELTNIPWSS